MLQSSQPKKVKLCLWNFGSPFLVLNLLLLYFSERTTYNPSSQLVDLSILLIPKDRNLIFIFSNFSVYFASRGLYLGLYHNRPAWGSVAERSKNPTGSARALCVCPELLLITSSVPWEFPVTPAPPEVVTAAAPKWFLPTVQVVAIQGSCGNISPWCWDGIISVCRSSFPLGADLGGSGPGPCVLCISPRMEVDVCPAVIPPLPNSAEQGSVALHGKARTEQIYPLLCGMMLFCLP